MVFRLLISGIAFLSASGCGPQNSDIAEALSQAADAKKKFVAAGLPLNVKELNESIKIPANQNAYDLMEKLDKKWEKLRDEHRAQEAKNPSKVDPNNPWFPDLLPDLEKFIDRPYCWSPMKDFLLDPMSSFPKGAFKKQLVKQALKAVENDFTNRDVNAALHHYQVAARVANWEDDDGSLIGMLVRCASDAIILESLKNQLATHYDDKQFVDGLKPVLDELSTPLNTAHLLAVESLAIQTYVQETAKISPQELESLLSTREDAAAQKSKIKLLVSTPRAMEALITRMYQLYTAVQEKLPKDLEDFKQWDEAAATMTAVGSRTTPSYLLANDLTDVYSRFVRAPKTRRSMINVALQGWEAAKYWHAHGSFPTTLSLDSKAQTDFEIYAPLKTDFTQGFKVWTVGKNHVDDGGIRNSKTKQDDYGINLVNRTKN